MNQQRSYSRLLLYSVLLFVAAACIVLSSSNKSVIRGSNLRKVQVASRYLEVKARSLASSKDEEEDSDVDLDSDSEDEADQEWSGNEEAGDAADESGADAGGKDDSDADEGDQDSDSDEDETRENSGEEEPSMDSSNQGDFPDGIDQMSKQAILPGSPLANSAKSSTSKLQPSTDASDPLFNQVAPPDGRLANSTGKLQPFGGASDPQSNQTAPPGDSSLANSSGNGDMSFSVPSQAGEGSPPSTPQEGTGLDSAAVFGDTSFSAPSKGSQGSSQSTQQQHQQQQDNGFVSPVDSTNPFGGGQGGSPESSPVDIASPFGQGEEPTRGFPADPNSPATQFGDTPFLGQGNTWTATTPPIEDVESWITPIEPTDEDPVFVTSTENANGQGDALNQNGYPSGGKDFATPASGEYGFHSTTSSSFSPPSGQGGGFNSQYRNSQYNGNNGGQTKKQGGGGLAGAWKNMKDKSVEHGKSSLGEEIKEEEELEEEEVADEMEGINDDDNLSSTTEENKPPDADDEFEKMIEDAEGKTSTEKGTSKETKEETVDDFDAEEKEEIAEEELQEVEEELKEEEEVAAAAGGMGFLLAVGGMIFTAHQMSENPDGVYASVCRLAITVSGVIVKIICMPCRKVIGTGNPHYGTHMRVSTSADYGMGDANAGFELS